MAAKQKPEPAPTADSRGHAPAGKWAFDGDVTAVFDDMLERSIPAYGSMRELVFDVGVRAVTPGTPVIDLGCSKGDALAPFVDKFGAYNRYRGVECSAPMADAAEGRFRGMIDAKLLRIDRQDLRTWFPPERDASLVLAVLTIQFLPVNYRPKVLREAFDALRPGGALVVVEKVQGESFAGDRMLVDLYHAGKVRAGYTPDEVTRKALALEGVLTPLSAAENVRQMHAAGFATVQQFWQHLSFCGWAAIK